MKILITTSGVGSRLGEMTKYTNKSLIRVGKKPAISYIVENYPKNSEFVITLGYHGNQVEQFLKMAYPDYNFTFVNVNLYDGPGSSLGYSMLCAKDHLQCPFIFNACDTLLDKKIDYIENNWIGGSNKGLSSQYRSFSVAGNKVINIHEKGENKYDFEYLGVCAVKDWEIFWESLEKSYKENPQNIHLSDCDALKECIKKTTFYYNKFEWFDIGNLDSLKEARTKIEDEFSLLDKVDESIFIFDDFVIKFFYDKTSCRNRVERAKILNGLVPEIIESSDYFYKYKFADGYLLSDVTNVNNFSNLLYLSEKKLWKKCGEKSEQFYNICKDFYFKKTIKRLNKFHNDNNMIDQAHIINGIEVPSIKSMLDLIDEKWLCDVEPYHFHGDFILDNMIINKDKITLLDWRQDFGGSLEYGDFYYDLGKLNHNLIINHSIVHGDGFYVKYEGNNIVIDILRKNILVECQDILKSFIINNKLDLKKVNVLSAIIWLNMSPLHDKKFGLFMYFFGKYNLWKIIGSNNE